jgi:hypothetical protein
MGKRTHQIATSPGLKFRQRLVLSALAHDTRNRGRAFDPQNMRRLAQEIARNPIADFCEALTQEQLADHLTAAHKLDHEIQPRHVMAVSRASPGLGFLKYVADMRNTASIANASQCYLATLCHALLTIECDPEQLPKESLTRRLTASRHILECIRRRWQPSLDGRIHLPALPLDFLTPLNVRRIKAHRLPVAAALTAPGHRDKHFLPISLPLSPETRRLFPRQADDAVFMYLCAIPFDREVLHPAARLRWAIDLTSCLLALQNLLVCLARSEDLLARERSVADAMHGMAANLWDGANGNCWTETLRLLEVIGFPTARENRARAAAASDTIGHASLQFRDVLRVLQIEERWLWDFWDLAAYRDLDRKGVPLHFSTRGRTSSALRLWNRNIRNLPTLTTERGVRSWLASLQRRPPIEGAPVPDTADMFEDTQNMPVVAWADRQAIAARLGTRLRSIVQKARRDQRSLNIADYEAIIDSLDEVLPEIESSILQSRTGARSDRRPLSPAALQAPSPAGNRNGPLRGRPGN